MDPLIISITLLNPLNCIHGAVWIHQTAITKMRCQYQNAVPVDVATQNVIFSKEKYHVRLVGYGPYASEHSNQNMWPPAPMASCNLHYIECKLQERATGEGEAAGSLKAMSSFLNIRMLNIA